MSEWKVLRLGEVADIQNGYAFKSAEFADNGVPIIKIKNIVPPVIVLNEVQYYKNVISQKLKQYLVKKNDFLISMTGSTVNQMASAVGKMSRYQHEFPSFINQRVAKIYSTSDLVSDDYLFYYLNRYEVQYDLALTASGSANQANISPEQLKSYKISFPDLPTQKSITEILSSIDDKIELNNKINQELETLAQTLFKQWFIDFEFPNQNGEPYKSSGGEMVDSELGEIPKGWEVNILENYIDIINGYAFKSEDYVTEGIPIIRTKNFNDNGFLDLNDLVYLMEEDSLKYEKFKLKLYDKLVVMVGASIGKSVIVTSKIIPALQNQNMWNFRAKNKVYQSFTNFLTDLIVEQNLGSATGSAREFFRKDFFYSRKIQVPSLHIVIKFGEVISALYDKLDDLISENLELTNLRETLLPKLISGELEINEISN